ncbi:MAG TPA: hypothetical protein VM536_00770 [Chloroflexia bacterium]|nr:hypothetical protein [Chloroflexia bacterium]
MTGRSPARPPPDPAARRRTRLGLGVAALVLFALLRGVLWAFLVPPLDAPDEPSHLIAVAQIRTIRGLPVAKLVDPNTLSADSTERPPALLAYLAHYQYTRFRALSYESTQPPLYYLLCAVLTRPLPDDPATLLYGCRLVSALLGALTVFAAARAAATLAPDRPAFALGVPLALVLWPQVGFQSATVTNDIGLDLAGAALAWAWASALRARDGGRGVRWPLVLGALTGLGLLTKLTVLATLPATGLVLLGRLLLARGTDAAPGPVRRLARPLLRDALLAGGSAALLVGPWLLRNLAIYGEPTGAAQMFGVIRGIYTTRLGLPAGTRIIVPPLDQLIWHSFSSFWAVFGWRGVYLPSPLPAPPSGADGLAAFLAAPLYWVAALVMGLGVAGALAWQARRRTAGPLPAALRWTLAAYALTAAAALVGYVLYTLTTDASLQGRYTFVALVPFAVIGVGGVLHATRSAQLNRRIAVLSLAGLLVLHLAAWAVIGRP